MDSVIYINKLLVEKDKWEVQEIICSYFKALTEITELETNLERFSLSVKAGCYDEGLEWANQCRLKFEQWEKIDDFKISQLKQKYKEVLILIKTKLLNEFDVIQEETTIQQLQRASYLLKLLNEKERTQFLCGLADRICEFMPKGKISKNHLEWIYPLLDNDKYKVLVGWGFEKYIIDSWAQKLRDLIFEEKELTKEMLIYTKKTEEKLRRFHPDADGLISISFDLFCKENLTLIFDNHPMKEVSLKIEGDLFNSFCDLIIDLLLVKKEAKIFLNNRTNLLMLQFFQKRIDQFLTSFLTLFETQKDFDGLQILKNSLVYFNKELENISKLGLSLKQTTWAPFNEKLNSLIYNWFKVKILNHLEKTITDWKPSLIKIRVKKTQEIMDVSEDIEIIINILTKIKMFNENILSYLLSDINLFYIKLVHFDNLAKFQIEGGFLTQIIMDISVLKDNLKTDIFKDVLIKLQLVTGEILDEKSFLALFRSVYQNHTLELLTKLLKIKNISKKKQDLILEIYKKG